MGVHDVAPLVAPPDLRAMRERAGLTQAELARRVGTTQSAVARWERGAVVPSLAAAARLAAACGQRLELVGGTATGLDHAIAPDEVARLEANLALSPAQRLARATRAARFVLRGRRAMAEARDGGRGGR